MCAGMNTALLKGRMKTYQRGAQGYKGDTQIKSVKDSATSHQAAVEALETFQWLQEQLELIDQIEELEE